MDYLSSLEYLYALQHFGIKLGLENTRRLLGRLGNPQRQLKIVHIAGTNGKGSTSAALEQILRSAGLRTGLYTSPHLHSFTERIRIDSQPVSEAEVVTQTDAIRCQADGLSLTFFEFTTAMALQIFAQRAVDWVILETGLGGRLDATNIVDPQLTVITSIAYDHATHLGESLAQIAGEKAGIIKPGVPLISARQDPEVLAVLQRIVLENKVPFQLAGRDFDWTMPPETFGYRGVTVALSTIEPGLAGVYQRENISLALAAAEQLLNDPLDPVTTCSALAELRWPGRLEWCGDVLLDGAHNPQAAEALAGYLGEQDLDGLLWVVAVKSDKDAAGILAPLLSRVDEIFVAPLDSEVSLPPGQLLQFAAQAGVGGESLDSPAEALEKALAVRRPGQKILVAGSLFLVAALRGRCLSLSGATA